MKNYSNKQISFSLFVMFLILYTLLIPFYTSKPDVIVFALRSLADLPIFDIAYLDSSTYLSGGPLPNYHLGHTLVLWLVYQIAPQSLASTIWPAGFISAISGALIVVLTFLIWKILGLNNKKAIIISLVVGLIPSFVEQSIIGEVYTLQFSLTLLFVYLFLVNKWILSSIIFLFACLVSPLSGLAYGLLFLQKRDKTTILKALAVGAIALFLYLIIFLLLGSDLLMLLSPDSEVKASRGLIYRIGILLIFVVLNFNFFVIYLIRGFKVSFILENKVFSPLLFATIPQLLLLFAGATFFIELGSFQLPLFWALAVPLGIYLSEAKINSGLLFSAIILSLALNYTLWIYPNTSVGSSREEAGKWLKINGYNEISVISPWSIGPSIIKGREGNDLSSMNKFYLNKPCPGNSDLLKTNKDILIIAESKKLPLRVMLSEFEIPGFNINYYNPGKNITVGSVEKIFENESVQLYEWNKNKSSSIANTYFK